MKLKQAANYFDRLVFADAYTPATTFLGQLDVFDDSRRDGMTIERRILSVAPTVTIPARRTVTSDGLTWLIGDSQRDYYKTEAIRHKYVMHIAEELVAIKTPDQAIQMSTGSTAWASRVWVKPAKEIEISSDVSDVFNIYFARNETPSEGSLIYMASRWHLIRSVYPTTAGLLVALTDELPEPVRTSMTLTSRTYVPATDTYTTTPVTVTGLRIRWQSHFRYLSRASEKFKPGDIVAVIRKLSGTPVAGSRVTIGSDTYNVVAVLDEGLCWVAHLQR